MFARSVRILDGRPGHCKNSRSNKFSAVCDLCATNSRFREWAKKDDAIREAISPPCGETPQIDWLAAADFVRRSNENKSSDSRVDEEGNELDIVVSKKKNFAFPLALCSRIRAGRWRTRNRFTCIGIGARSYSLAVAYCLLDYLLATMCWKQRRAKHSKWPPFIYVYKYARWMELATAAAITVGGKWREKLGSIRTRFTFHKLVVSQSLLNRKSK